MRRLVLVCALSGQLVACSFASMERVSGRHRREAMPRCSAATAPIVADAGIALYYSLLAARTVADFREAMTDDERDDARDDLAFQGTLALAAGASIWYGLVQRDRCADARATHESWLVDHWALPPFAPAPPSVALPASPPATPPPVAPASPEPDSGSTSPLVSPWDPQPAGDPGAAP